MGITYSRQYYITISKLPTDDDTEPLILYSNLTDNLDSIQDFLLGNTDSKISKNIKKQFDNWFETNKNALNELQEDNLEYEKRRKVPVTAFDIKNKAGYYIPQSGDSVEEENRMDREAVRDWNIIMGYERNPNPYNHYITSGFLECNTMADFFDKSRYGERYSKIKYTHPKEATGLEYFFLFFEKYMNKDFYWNKNKYHPIPLKITLQVRYRSYDFESRNYIDLSTKMLGLSPKDWRQSKKVCKEKDG